jgi:hypothetical protein
MGSAAADIIHVPEIVDVINCRRIESAAADSQSAAADTKQVSKIIDVSRCRRDTWLFL